MERVLPHPKLAQNEFPTCPFSTAAAVSTSIEQLKRRTHLDGRAQKCVDGLDLHLQNELIVDFTTLMLLQSLALADPSSKRLEILRTALSRSSWDLGSCSSVLHLFQRRCQVKLLCCRLHRGEKKSYK